jgi:hypothetical protein
MMPNRILAFSLALQPAGAGCTALERAHDCGGVVDIVNGSLSDIRFDAPDAGDAETYERFATTYEDVSKKIELLAIEDTALAKAVESYRDVVQRAAKQSRAYARELTNSASNNDKAGRRSAERRMEKLRAQAKTELSREASAVRKLNTLCHPK